jgi:hypothetical protein
LFGLGGVGAEPLRGSATERVDARPCMTFGHFTPPRAFGAILPLQGRVELGRESLVRRCAPATHPGAARRPSPSRGG